MAKYHFKKMIFPPKFIIPPRNPEKKNLKLHISLAWLGEKLVRRLLSHYPVVNLFGRLVDL